MKNNWKWDKLKKYQEKKSCFLYFTDYLKVNRQMEVPFLSLEGLRNIYYFAILTMFNFS